MKTLGLLFLLACIAVGAQDLKSIADASFQNQKWDEAVKGYRPYLKKNPSDSSAWYRLAFVR